MCVSRIYQRGDDEWPSDYSQERSSIQIELTKKEIALQTNIDPQYGTKGSLRSESNLSH